MSKKNKMVLFCTVVFSLLKAILNINFAFMLKNVLDFFETGTKSELYHQILVALLFLFIYINVEVIYNYFESIYITKQIRNLKANKMKSILSGSITSFNNKHSGGYLSLFTNDVKTVEEDYYSSIFDFISMMFCLVISIFALIYLSLILGIVSILITIISMILPIVLTNKLNVFRYEFSKKQDYLTRKTKSIFDGFETIKMYNVEEMALNDYIEGVESVEKHNKALKFFLKSTAAVGRVMGFVVFFVIIFTGLFLSIQNKISFGVLLASIQLSNNLVSPIVMGIQTMAKFRSVKNIREKFDYSIVDQKQYTGQSQAYFERDIVLQNITFSYDNNSSILQDINIKVEKGKKYAIVGESGSGKSTLGKILMGVLHDYEGQILLDGKNILKYDTNDVLKLFSVMNQNTFLFDDTIEKNISFYRNVSSEEINKVLTDVQLSHFVGKNNLVGENGVLLSGGEQQRISLARSFINKSPILLLDEATSQLDNENMMKIEKLVLSSPKTVITITHNLVEAILNKYDMIFVMSHGRLVEQGSYKDLIHQKGFLYSLCYILNNEVVED